MAKQGRIGNNPLAWITSATVSGQEQAEPASTAEQPTKKQQPKTDAATDRTTAKKKRTSKKQADALPEPSVATTQEKQTASKQPEQVQNKPVEPKQPLQLKEKPAATKSIASQPVKKPAAKLSLSNKREEPAVPEAFLQPVAKVTLEPTHKRPITDHKPVPVPAAPQAPVAKAQPLQLKTPASAPTAKPAAGKIQLASERKAVASGHPLYLLPVSAKTKAALWRKLEDLSNWLAEEGTNHSLLNMAYTLLMGRSHYSYRVALLVKTHDELRSTLQFVLQHGQAPNVRANLDKAKPKQDPQVVNLGNVLLEQMNVGTHLSDAEYQQKLYTLAQMYVDGFKFNGHLLYSSEQGSRISMPTYPFAKDPYWVPGVDFSAHKAVQAAKAISPSTPAVPEILYYGPQWTPAARNTQQSAIRNVLLLDRDGTRRTALQQRLAQTAGHPVRVFSVQPGDAFADLGNDAYQVHPQRTEDYERLLDRLRAQQALPDHLLNLWPEQDRSADVLHAFYHLVRALAQTNTKSLKRCLHVYDSNSTTLPFGQSLNGFAKSLQFLWPDLRVSTVGLSGLGADEALAEIAGELTSACRDEDFDVRYQGSARWSRLLIPLSLQPNAQPLAKKHGVYLITGGAGGLGLMFARDLAQRFQAKIVLVGRSPLNAERAAKIEQLKQLGSDVLYCQADVGNEADMKQVLADAKRQFGSLNGIIHAAGILSSTVISKKDPAEWETTLRPKFAGTAVLDELTRDEPLDFFALFSSTSAVLGDMGQCDYAVGNRFLDAFAEHREALRKERRRHGQTVAVNWPIWREGGMHLDPQGEELYLQSSGMAYLETDSGIESFHRILNSGHTQVMVIAGDRARVERFLLPQKETNAAPATAAVASRPAQPVAKALTTDDLAAQLEADIRNVAADLMKLSAQQLDVNENFGNYGFDSINLKKLSQELSDAYGLDLSPTIFFANSTIRSLTEHLLAEHEEHLKQYAKAAQSAAVSEVAAAAPVVTVTVDLEAGLIAQLRGRAADYVKMRPDQLDIHENFGNYGFDSISLKKWANELSAAYGVDIPPTVFFAHSTVHSLADYLLDHVEEAVLAHEAQPAVQEAPQPAPAPLTAEAAPVLPAFAQANVHANEAVAIIGVSGIFPQSNGLEEFWQHLESVHDLVTEIPQERWDWRDYYEPGRPMPNKSISKWGGFVSNVDKFDPSFFSITPHEAELIDPQHRLLLETTWKSIEDAGYKASQLSGRSVGVFVGVQFADYLQLIQKAGLSQPQIATGNAIALLANRISYLLNLHGPSEAMDTACSSSLIAVHRAVKSIQNGESELAIAGGVSLMLSPDSFVTVSQLGVLSPTGRCHSFDQKANGYVRGEGVGALLLKPLSKAEADGDHIYAVIRGSAENHGGKANSLTAPNSEAQAQLLIRAYAQAGIDPEHITYIEAHGTGTELGDPVEIEGMKKAFQTLYKKAGKQPTKTSYCGIGTVKTNIGHLEPASGMAGIIKVLLAIKHKTLPGTVHFDKMNPFIQIDQSPFYIVDRTMPWEPGLDSAGRRIPRIAGVSSFGFGGANAHVILQEYEASQRIAGNAGPQIIVLSAKAEDRLHAYAAELADFLRTASGSRLPLADIAFTLQAGREEMDERLALVVSSTVELADKLAQVAQGRRDISAVFRGNRRRNKEQLQALQATDGGSLADIAQRWALGAQIDWTQFHAAGSRNRLPLPTYPFARERYWIAETASTAGRLHAAAAKVEGLHPMLDRNTSTFAEQKFTKQLTGDEFYLADHVVDGRLVLPGVATLEMARAGGAIAAETPVRKLQNIIWAQPVEAGSRPKDLHTGLYLNGDAIEFETFTIGSGGQRIIHAQGKLDVSRPAAATHGGAIDLDALRNRLPIQYSSEDCYRQYDAIGLTYGPSFRPIQELAADGREALARLQVPPHLGNGIGEFVLHPSLLDGALQAIIGLRSREEAEGDTLYLPFALGELEIFDALAPTCYSYMKLVSDATGIKKYDVNITDESGRVLVRIKDFSVKRVPKRNSAAQPDMLELFRKLQRGEISVQEAEQLTGGVL